MRPDTAPRRVRHLLLAVITALVLSTGFVAVAEPAHAAAKPAKVKGVKLKKPRVEGTTASFKVKWKRAARATSYKVKWKVPGGKAHKDRTTKTSMTIKNLAQGANYCVKVRAYNGKRKGKWSKTVCRMTAQLPLVQPVWVDAQSVQAGGTVAMQFRWNEVPGATSYELDYLKGEKDIQKQKQKGNTKTAVVGTTGGATASVTIGGLDPSSTYCFQVRPSGPVGVGAFGTAGCKVTEPLSRAVGGPVHVNMMTWNICSSVCDNPRIDRPWATRAAPARDLIAATGADAVALQESGQGVSDLEGAAGYERACIVGNGYLKNPNNHTVYPLNQNTDNQSLLVRSAKFEVDSDTANGLRFYGYSHGACWVRVRDKITNNQLILVSVHLTNPGWPALDQVRANQTAALMTALAADSNTAGLQIVIGGDFNSTRNNKWDGPREYLNLPVLGYDDAFDVAERYNALPYVDSWNNWVVPGPQSWRWGGHVDRVFVSPGSRVTTWQTVSPWFNGVQLSDHSAVRVEVDIP